MFNQDKSRQELEKQVRSVVAERFPLERRVGKGEGQHVYIVDVSNLKFEYPDTSFKSQAKAFSDDETLEGVVKADIQVKKDGKAFHKASSVTLSAFPVPTERGTYIINGNEKVFLHQMLRRPGIYALPTKVQSGEKTKEMVIGEVNTNRARYRLEVDRKNGRLMASNLKFEYGTPGSSSVDGISFLRMLGATDAEIAAICGNDEIGKEIYATFMAHAKPMSVKQIHEKTHVRPYVSDEETLGRIQELMSGQTFSENSQRVNEISTGMKVDKVGKDAFLGVLKAMVREIRPDEESPSLDDPRFKTILVPEAIIARSIDKGIGAWMNKMNTSLFRASNFGEAKKEKAAFRPASDVTRSVRGLYSGQLSEAVDSGNPLDLHQKLRKVTSLGDFGLSSNSVSLSNRNLYPGMFAKVDPVETPQSGSMGIVEYLARDAEVKDGLVYSKFFRVRDGKVDASKVIDDIDPLDEDKEYIAFNDPSIYEKDGKTWTLKKGKVRARHDSKFVEVDSSKVTLIDRSPVSHLSYATGLIPFASNNDGARLLMGASMQKQALPVTGAEAPLVQADSQVDGRTADQELADNISHNLKAPFAGTIAGISEGHITIKKADGSEEKVEKLNYFSTGKNSGYIHHKPVVKVGDTVKQGQLLADGWHSKNGEFALGKNTTVAYMPYEGLNFEDGVVVSESFAKKMASEEVKMIDHVIKPDLIAANQTLSRNGATYKVDTLLSRESKVSKEQLKKLDARGIIKKGQEFLPGDVLVAAFSDTSQIEDTEHRLTAQKRHGAFAFKPFKASGYQKGKVIDVHVKETDDGQKVTIKYIVEKPMEKGDKLSGRHGNKGTISDIIPDDQMPRIGGKDGEPVELIFSPLAVPSRKNLGQLYEVHAGMLAKQTGQSKYVMKSFDRNERDRLLSEMEKAGMGDGKFTLYNPKNGREFESKVTVGPMYIMKLKHKVEGKVTRRSTDRVGKTVDFMTNMPKKISGSVDGERQSPQAIGGMEFWSLTSAGAVENIHEMTTLKSDGIDKARGRIDLYDAIASGRPLPKPVTPETLKNLQDYLYGAGIRMSPMKDGKETTLDDQFTSLMLSPNKAKDDAFKGLPEVYSSKLDRVTSKIDQKDLKHALGKETGETTRNRKGEEIAKGGLYDTDIFGEDADRWGKITLAAPVANPIFLKNNNAYAALLYKKGFKNNQVKDLAQGKLFYVFDDGGVSGLEKGSLVNAKTIDDLMFKEEKLVDAATGGEALERLLKEVNLKETYKAIREELDGAGKVEDKTTLVNHARVVAHAIDRGYKPEDYLLRTVPVMPLKYRPSIKGQGNSVSHDDLTKLYQHVIEDNVRYGQAFSGWKKEVGKHDIDRNEDKTPVVHKGEIPQIVAHERKGDSAAALYKRVEDLVGTKSPADSGVTKPGTKKTEEDLKGILDRLSSKKGFLREKMQKKSQDFSGRSVIVVDPTLDLDEVSLPEDMVKEMFEPHIIKELGKMGYNSPTEARKQISAGNRHYRAAVMQVLKDNPVILNRAPSLHKHSLQAFNVAKVSWNDGGENGGTKSRAIGLNPVVTTPFNADFDGDSLLNSVFVRFSKVGIEKNAVYNEVEGEGHMPVTGDTKVRYRYGLVNLKEFPRTALKESKGNKEIYHVPEGVEILTVWNNEQKWLPVESFSIHKDLDMLQVKTNTSRTLQVSDDHSLVTVDEELNYMRAPAKVGMTLPRLRKPIRGNEYELLHELKLPEVSERKHSFKETIPLNFDSGYFFGAYIGDGWVNPADSKKKNDVCMADSNGEVIKKVRNVIDSYLENGNIHVCSMDSPHKFNEKDSFCVKRTWTSAKFSSLLREHIGSGAKNKKLPDFWLMTAATFRWGLLSGLIDTDGSVSKSIKKRQTNVNITTTSHQLAYGIVALAHSLDMNASVTVSQTPAGEICYVVTFAQESILAMKRHIWLANKYKMDILQKFELGKTGSRNKYTPKLSVERLVELRKEIGCPPFKNGRGELTVPESELSAIKARRSLYMILSRVLKNDTALTQDTALRIIDEVPELFEEGFWAKWKSLVLDPEIEWELLTEIEPLPFISEAYDLTVPPNFTMVTESGIVVYDTMSVHVPLSDAAKREARELLMPSKNLINPTNNSMIMELKHEMQLGIFYSTRDRMPNGQQLSFKSFKELEEAYQKGEVHTYQPVLMNVRDVGNIRATAGQHLFNLALVDARVPKEFVDYATNVDMDSKKVRQLMEKILAHPRGGSMVVTRALNNLKRVGFKTATHSGMSIGIRDFDALAKVDKKRMLAEAKDDQAFKAKLKKDDPSLYKAVYENPVNLHAKQLEAFEQAKSNFVLNELKSMVDSKGGKSSILGAENSVSIMMQSGARGNAGQVVGMAGIVGVGKDVENKATAPVNASLMEGLRPDEFFTMSADSRKGIYDKSVATQDPGALTRQIWFANRHMVIAEEKCSDRTGITLYLKKDKNMPGSNDQDLRHLRGRVLLEPIQLPNGASIRPSNQPISMQDFERVQQAVKSNKMKQVSVKVRSPLTCKSTHGVCQQCYGARPGAINNELVPIGEAVGSIAAQALGEPSQQAIMRTFHSGAGQSSTTNAFEQIRNVLELSSTAKPNTAIVATTAGVITKIVRHPFTGTSVTVDSKEYKLGSLPINPELREGVRVDVCESLTDPRSTHVNPRDVLHLKGEKAAQSYLIDTVSDAFRMGNIDDTDRRHLELTVGVMTDRAVIKDPGTTGLLPGQTVRKNFVEEQNRKIRRGAAYEAPLTFQNQHEVIGKHLAKDVKSLTGRKLIGKKGAKVDQRMWEELRKDGRRYVTVTDAKPATFDAQLFGVQNDTKMADGQWLGNAAFRNSKTHLLMGAAMGSEDELKDPLTAQMAGKKGNFGSNFSGFVSNMQERFGGLF